jgi:hypothetical protein
LTTSGVLPANSLRFSTGPLDRISYQVGHVLHLQVFLQPLRHRGAAGCGKLLDLGPQQDVRLALRIHQGDARGGLHGQHAGVIQPVLEHGEVTDVTGFHGPVRVEQGDEDRFRRLVSQRHEVGADRLSDVAELVAGGAASEQLWPRDTSPESGRVFA